MEGAVSEILNTDFANRMDPYGMGERDGLLGALQ